MDATQRDWRGLAGYGLLALAIGLGAQIAFHARPVAATDLITADRADAATAVATGAVSTAESARLRRKIGAWIAAAEPAPSP